MNEFIEQFLVECRELVVQATDDLLALEEMPGDRERLDGAFRAFHTLKGAAGIIEFPAMERALHAAENLLAAVRSGGHSVTAGLISDCLTCIDQVVQWLDVIEETGEPPADAAGASDAIVARFGVVAAPVPEPAPRPEGGADLPALAQQLLAAQLALIGEAGAEAAPGRIASAARVAANLLRHLGRGPEAERLERQLGPLPDPLALAAVLRTLAEGGGVPVAEVAPREAAEPTARNLRVDIERIDALVNLTDELTVAKNALGHAAELARGGAEGATLADLLRAQHTALDRLVRDLQRSVLNIRVLPLRQVFQRFPRPVREMVAQLGKPARLVTEGENVEADKAVVEALFEPLLHVIRNALDHGVESAEARATAGKPPSATILLRASRVGDRVHVEVQDDGSGVDLPRVREAALARGLASAEALEAMSDEAAVDLIFTPGFSTAAEVSHMSGRGVGMDAVRTAVERLGGRVTIESTPGAGTTVRLILPFTVLMSQVMTVEAGGQMFGIPLEAVVETLRLSPDRISAVGAARAFVLRDRTIPLISLGEVLGDGGAGGGAEAHVVVTVATGGLAGLQVDRLGERMEVMLKPMEGLLAGAAGVAGATLLGDGRVLIVLDLEALLE